MRFLFLVSRDDKSPQAAGGDVQGSVYARLLAEAGHSVTYLTSHFPGGAVVEVSGGVEVRRIAPPLLLALASARWYRRHGDAFDVVYEEAFGGAKLPLLAPMYVRQPLITAWYQVNRPLFRAQLGRAAGSGLGLLERLVARLHQRATIVTPAEGRRKDLISQLGFRAEQVFAVPPIALDSRLISEAPPVGGRMPQIVWLGKLRRYKCVHHAVAAMPQLLSQVPQARLLIAGRREDGAYERELRRQIDALNLGANVSFALDLTEEAKVNLLRRARALVVTTPVEGFGIVILEANACGTPALATNGVPLEAVAHGYNGLRFPFGDTPALAQALVLLLTDDGLHDRLAGNGILFARQFTRSALETRLWEVITAATSQSRAIQKA